jgi:hypothetical protein
MKRCPQCNAADGEALQFCPLDRSLLISHAPAEYDTQPATTLALTPSRQRRLRRTFVEPSHVPFSTTLIKGSPIPQKGSSVELSILLTTAL